LSLKAGGQIKLALDATIALNGENYVFFLGEVVKDTCVFINTDMGRIGHMGQFLTMARVYKSSKGSKEISLSNQNQWNNEASI
jgi:xylose isomerase